MNNYAYKSSGFAACEEIWSAGRSATVVCPKPRRAAFSRAAPHRMSLNREDCDMKAGNELLDFIRSKDGSCGPDQFPGVESSPPYFAGSPPGRVSNPMVHDVRFGDENYMARSNFGNTPVVRVEGFDCVDSCTVRSFV